VREAGSVSFAGIRYAAPERRLDELDLEQLRRRPHAAPLSSPGTKPMPVTFAKQRAAAIAVLPLPAGDVEQVTGKTSNDSTSRSATTWTMGATRAKYSFAQTCC
jgi:hypothetical protein